MLLTLLAATAHAQEVREVITATADARDLALLGDRVIVATEGGVVVVREGVVERVIGPRDGLPGARARSVSVIGEGLWIGGVEGTALLDARDLRVVRTLPLRRVRRAVRFADRTWMASFGDGLFRIDGGDATPIRLGTANAYVRLTDLCVRGDELWVATSGIGILRVGADGRVRGRIRRREGLPNDYVWRLVPHGDRVIAATIDGVAELDPSGAVVHGSMAAIARRLPVRDVRDVAIDGETVWLATFGRGVWRSESGGRPRLVSRAITEANALLATDAGVLVAHAGGVARVTDHVEPIVSGGLPSGDVTSLARAFGTLWAGTFEHGLARMRDGRFEVVSEALERWGVDRRVNDLVVSGRGSDQRLWIATDRGLYWHDGRLFSRVDDPYGPGGGHVSALHVARDGALWVASSHELCRFDRRWRCWSGDPSAPVAQLQAVTTDSRGRVWVGSLHGLYRFDPASGAFERHTVSSGDLPVDWVTALVPWGDGVMAGTYHGGLALGDGTRFRIVREEDGLPSGWVNPHALRRIDGAVWIGTLERGLVVGRPGAWQHITAAEGLPSDDVTDVLQDGDAVWVATRGGIARLER